MSKIDVCYTFEVEEKIMIKSKEGQELKEMKLLEQRKSNLVFVKKDFLFLIDTIGANIMDIIANNIYQTQITLFSDKFLGSVTTPQDSNFVCFYGFDKEPKDLLLKLFLIKNLPEYKTIKIIRKDKRTSVKPKDIIITNDFNLCLCLFEDYYLKIIRTQNFYFQEDYKEFDCVITFRPDNIFIYEFMFQQQIISFLYTNQKGAFLIQRHRMDQLDKAKYGDELYKGEICRSNFLEKEGLLVFIEKVENEYFLNKYSILTKEKLISIKLIANYDIVIFKDQYVLFYFGKKYEYKISSEEKSQQQQQQQSQQQMSGQFFIFDIVNEYNAFKLIKGNIELNGISSCETGFYITASYKGQNETKELFKFKENTDQEKIDKFLNKPLFQLAFNFVENKNLSELKPKICMLAGDYYYQNNKYDLAIKNYIEIIKLAQNTQNLTGDYEPSLVIKKFLETSQLPFIIQYLKALCQSEKRLANKEHISLLIYCFLKQKSHKELQEWLQQVLPVMKKSEIDIIQIAIQACQEFEETDLAIQIAKESQRNDLYFNSVIINAFYVDIDISPQTKMNVLSNLIESLRNITNQEEQMKLIKDHGKLLLKYKPRELALMIMDLIKSGKSDKCCQIENFIALFENFQEVWKMPEAHQFCEFAYKNIEQQNNKQLIAQFIINFHYYVMKNADYLKEQYLQSSVFINKLLLDQKFLKLVNIDYAINLFFGKEFQEKRFKLYEITGRTQDLIRELFEQQLYDECINKIQISTDSELKLLFLQLLCEVNQGSEEEQQRIMEYIQTTLSFIKVNEFHPNFIINILKNKAGLSLKYYKEYLISVIGFRMKVIKELKRQYYETSEKINKKTNEINKINTQGFLCQSTNCFRCKQEMGNQAVYFLCGHSFHADCLGSYECPQCEKDQHEISEKRKIFEISEIPEGYQFVHNTYEKVVEWFGKIKI